MFLVGFVSWWYGAGWRGQLERFSEHLGLVADRWSIGALAGTLFAPFRQLDTGRSSGPLSARFRLAIDKAIGRMIGAMVRTAMIVAGLLVFVLNLVVGLVWLAIWPVLPVFPVLGLVLTLTGWLPWGSYV